MSGSRSVAGSLDDQVREQLLDLARSDAPLEPLHAIDAAVERVASWVHGLGPLEPVLADPDTTEVMVNSDGKVWVERRGVLALTSLRIDAPSVLHLIERIVAPLGLRIDRSSPVVDARLPDGSRVHAIIGPLAIDGPCLTIRRFGARRIGLDEVAGPEVVRLLRWAVDARLNLLVSGGTGSGKTTLLNALAAELHPDERVVTIEDAAELRLPGRHVVRLESRPANAEGVGEVRIRDLVRNALRMRPDRIIVGEIRGSEALDMLQAMNTGHDGSLSTCHANSPGDALRRVETLVLMGDVGLPLVAVREQIASAVDLVVQVERTAGGRRAVTAVDEVGAVDDGGNLGTFGLVSRGAMVGEPTRHRRGLVGSRHPAVVVPWNANLVACLAAVTVLLAVSAARARLLGSEGRRIVARLHVAPAPPGRSQAPLGGSRPRSFVVAVPGRLVRSLSEHRRRERADRLLIQWLDEAARGVRSGASLRQALAVAVSVAEGSDQAPALDRLAGSLHRGDPLEAALALYVDQSPSTTAVLVGRSVSLAGETGGRPAQLLDGVASTVRDRLELAREARALATQARASAVVIIAAPLAFAAVGASIDARVASFLFGSLPGLACVSVGLVLEVAGAFWMSRLVRRCA